MPESRKPTPKKTSAKKAAPNRRTRRAVEQAVTREAGRVKQTRDAALAERRGGATSAGEWRAGGRRAVFVELPSGNVCKAINKGMDAFLKAGKIPNALMPIVSEALNAAEGRPTASAVGSSVLEDPALLESTIELVNMVTCECVVEPHIVPVPTEIHVHPPDDDHDDEWEEEVVIPVEERDTEELLALLGDGLWVDETSLDDRFFIMNWAVGGTRNVEQFRKEFADVVDDLSTGVEAEPEA